TEADAPALGQSFDGLGAGFSGPQGSYTVRWAPPDTAGAVGTAHYIEIVNTDIAIFTKSGEVVYGPAATNTLFQGFGGACETRNDGDGTVEYDSLADRWVISQFALGGPPYYQCVAVSATADPTGAYHRYAFVYGDFPDYPKLGVWPDAYYTTFNMFQGGIAGVLVCAYERASMLAGGPASQQCVGPGASWGGSLLPADLDGSTPPPAGSPNYLLNLGSSRLNLWRFHVDWADPSNSALSGPTQLPVASFSPACGGGSCIPQPGTTQRLASLGDRPMYRLAYRNFGGHESLVVNHSVKTGTFGSGPSGVRWYELRDPGGTPTVHQQGTYAPDALYRWMGSAAMDGAGNLAVGYSVSSDSVKPGLRYASRLAADPLGTLGQGEGLIVDGQGVQLPELARWGDYTSLSVDPVDDCTFWYVGQYLKTDGAWNWSTRIASWSFPECTDPAAPDFSLAVSPASRTVTQGGGTSYTVSVSPAAGFASPVDLEVEGLPAGATAGFAPDPLTAADGWASTLSVSTIGATPAGTYPLTITGTGGGLTRTATVSLVVQPPAPPDFTLSISPSSRMIRPNGSTTYTVSIARTGGFADLVDLSVGGLPANYTWSFSQDPVQLATSQVTLTVRASSTKGSFTFTVSGLGGGLTRTAQAQLKVNGK
ncbi:MAG: hypothetical protein M3141_09140, partial [Actinomycetota bacterium]|nr:hypothetical protein [Actinomycetota bacterium]